MSGNVKSTVHRYLTFEEQVKKASAVLSRLMDTPCGAELARLANVGPKAAVEALRIAGRKRISMTATCKKLGVKYLAERRGKRYLPEKDRLL